MLGFLRTKLLSNQSQRLLGGSDLFSIRALLYVLQNPPSSSSSVGNLSNKQLFSSQASVNGSTRDPKQEKAELVKALLKTYGFNQTHISKFSRVCPSLFGIDPHKIILPKIQFYLSIGVSDADLPKLLTTHSVLLASSLEKKLIPNYNFLKDLLLSDESALKSFVRCPRMLSCDMQRVISPNIELLRKVGVPNNFITGLLRFSPDSLVRDYNKFKGAVDEVMKMGFDPNKLVFVLAVKVFCKRSQQFRDQKMEVYRRFGLSDEEIWALFRSRPTCMDHSEEKIVGTMDFLVNKMKLPPTVIVQCPAVLTLDLEKRVIPRCRVIKLLVDKDLVRKDLSIGSFLLPTEDKFLNKFVTNYEDELPGLMKIYQGRFLGLT